MAPKKFNGFMMFVNEWREKTAEGRAVSLPQAISKCGETWKNMNTQQRGPYNKMAKNAEVSARCQVERLNCHGQSLSALEREEMEAAERELNMKRTTERIVLAGKKRHDLENTKFIFAAFNYFTKSMTNDIYIPAEFSACQFSLKSGICSMYSSHIDPGQLIFGQGSETMHHTKHTHQLPLPPNAMGESDIGRLYANIVEYLRACNPDAKPNDPLVVFATPEFMPIVKGCFRYLESDSEEPLATIHIYDIQYLLYVLKLEVLDSVDIRNVTVNRTATDSLFINDYFCYHLGISCQYHEDIDRCQYCTQSIISRWCYVFSDFMCGDLAITPLPGKHMPPKQEPKFRVSNPGNESVNSSRISSNFSKTTNKSTGKVSNDTFTSGQSIVKHEIFDHSAFSADLNAAKDFPSLGGRKPKPNRNPMGKDLAPGDPRRAWNVPASKYRVKDFEDSFKMPPS
ncbi:PREDICTED: protein maelstrom [Drosophila arizonae]|uniref:Protein maelstrom n=1 Tax=Drosophila arizonae TaxID=7263 RepID=A0ABM1P746_DROAR|nr:PREDICTED: protein maelstrom [Drosophila arizonae]